MRSGFEEKIKGLLQSMLPKRVFWYEPLKIPYITEANYIPDFVLYKGKLKKPKKPLTKKDLKDMVLVEIKGYLRPSDKKKMISVKKSNPELDIRIVFQRDNYLTKSKKTKYSDWAEKNGFTYAIGEIPRDWFTD